jgi:hypothetical protein
MSSRPEGFFHSATTGGNGLFRFLVLYILFCGAPIAIAGFLGFYALSLEERFRCNQAVERLKGDLNRIVCGIDPDYYLPRRFSLFRKALFAGPLHGRRIQKLQETARRKWGFAFDAYVYDARGKLVSPQPEALRFRFLIQKIWNVLRTDPRIYGIWNSDQMSRFWEEWKIPWNVFHSADDDYGQNRQVIRKIFGDAFHVTKLSSRQDSVYRFSYQGSDGLLYWDITPRGGNGGVILIAWNIPGPLEILRHSWARKAGLGLSLILRDKGNLEHFFGCKPSTAPLSVRYQEFDLLKKPWVAIQDSLWVMTRIGGLAFFGGRATSAFDVSRSRKVLWGLLGAGAFLGYLLLSFLNRHGREHYIPIRGKLMFLFIYAVIIPMMGIGVLTYKALRDGKAAQIAENLKTATDALVKLDEDFLRERDYFLEFGRKLRDHPVLRGSDRDFLDVLKRLGLEDRSILVSVRKLDGTPVFSAKDGLRQAMSSNPIIDTFVKVCITTHLGDRLPPGPERVAQGGNPIIRSFLETPGTGFQNIISHPDSVHPFDFGGLKTFWYWDVFHDKTHPAAFFLISQEFEKAKELYLRRCLNSAGMHRQGAFRLMGFGDDKPVWFPSYVQSFPIMKDMMNRIRVLQQPLTDRIKIGESSFFVQGMPGKHLKGFSLLALFPESEVDKELETFRMWVFLGVLLMMTTSALIGFVLSDTFLHPIRSFSLGISALKRKQTTFRLPPLPRDEFGDLGLAFNNMMESLHEVSMGRMVQERLFPADEVGVGEYRVKGLSRPATDLGGDYFDYVVVDARYLLILVGDVTGHGVPAALIMAMAKSIVSRLSQTERNVETILQALNLVIFENMKKALFMTLGALWVDSVTHDIQLFNCGHVFPYIIDRDGRARLVQMVQRCMPIGMRPTLPMTPFGMNIGPGERILLYTDGLIESLTDDPAVDAFEMFAGFLSRRPRVPLDAACKDILDHHPFVLTGQPQPDDFTVVLLERSEDAGDKAGSGKTTK